MSDSNGRDAESHSTVGNVVPSFSIRPGESVGMQPLPTDRPKAETEDDVVYKRGGHDRSRFRRCTPDADANAGWPTRETAFENAFATAP